jgi:hypothetical protein
MYSETSIEVTRAATGLLSFIDRYLRDIAYNLDYLRSR